MALFGKILLVLIQRFMVRKNLKKQSVGSLNITNLGQAITNLG